MAEGWPKKRRLLGTKVKRLDGPDKATGRAKYSYDINRPGMLHGLILRSPHAHAKIKSIDTTVAKKVPGFKALAMILPPKDWLVVKAEGDTLELKSAPSKKKKEKEETRTVKAGPGVTIFRKNKVVTPTDLKADDQVQVEVERDAVGRELFYAGDEIAAVAADTEEHAKDALRAIKIEYEILDHVVSEEEVIKNPKQKTTPAAQNYDETIKDATKGDVGAGFQEAEATVEGTYGVPVISHQCLETHGLVAEWDADGGLTVWAGLSGSWWLFGRSGSLCE
ncbi:MAG: xanthine dehydrogenase family protein molybdopterin-binding subunit [Planctomycetes bacterium]|nr:xanthine dehydrogenase family protein molybdopterin-binding subunit [Planctomycetota bacterium]